VVKGLCWGRSREGLLCPSAALCVQDVEAREAVAQRGVCTNAVEVVTATHDEQLPEAPGKVGRRMAKPCWRPAAPDIKLPPRIRLQVQKVRIAVHARCPLLASGLDAAEDAEVPVALHGVCRVALALTRRYPRGRRHPPLALEDVEDHDEGRLVHRRAEAAEDIHAAADHCRRVAAARMRRLRVRSAQLPQFEGVDVEHVQFVAATRHLRTVGASSMRRVLAALCPCVSWQVSCPGVGPTTQYVELAVVPGNCVPQPRLAVQTYLVGRAQAVLLLCPLAPGLLPCNGAEALDLLWRVDPGEAAATCRS